MNRSRLLGIACTCILPLVTTFTNAQTPDDATPATEDVCDVLLGGTPGLYGLCVAYCEAHDADSSAEDSTASSRILEKYRARMAPGDLDMPCLTPCAEDKCWTYSELASINVAFCDDDDTDGIITLNGTNTDLTYAQTVNTGRCTMYIDGVEIYDNTSLDSTQVEACTAQILQRCP